MSKLEVIYICGIRSFGINESAGQKIHFFTPMTLFQGQNGCGKTTIMEAIRYAITGDVPGGSNAGQGFVSDPYMHNVPHVLAQIKLKFRDVKGKTTEITRVMRCERKSNGGLKFSTLDSALKYTKANGMIEDVTGRSGDINSIIVQLIGVSPAIFNNVLFCHQEDSLWPLGESTQIKKKFDDIFDSTSYNKCVDVLRKLIKTKSDKLDKLSMKLDYYKELKEEVESKKVQLRDKEEKFEKQNSEIEELNLELIPINTRLEEISELENVLLDLQKRKAGLENEIKNLRGLEDNIKKNLQSEYEGTDEELQEEINSFDTVREKQSRLIDDNEKEKKQAEKAEQAAAEAITKKNTKLVQIQEEKKSFKAKLQELKEGIENLGKALNCDLGGADNAAGIKILKRFLDEEKTKLSELIEETKSTNQQKQTEIDKCREKHIQTEQEKSMKSEEVKTCKKQLRELKMKLKDLDISDEKLKSFQAKIEKIDKDLESLQSSFNEEAVSKEIDKDKKSIKNLDSELEDLEREYKIQQNNSVTDKEIENLNSDISMWKNEIEKIKHKYYDEFNTLFTEFPENDIKKAVTDKISEATRSEIRLTGQINETQKNITKLETEKKFENDDLKKLEGELTKSQHEIELLCGETSYDEKCRELELLVKDFQRKKGQWSSAKILYEKFIDDITDKKCCPVCTTNFSTKQTEINEIITTLRLRIKDIPMELEKVEVDLSKNETLYKKIIALKSTNKRIKELSKILPERQETIKKINYELSEKKSNLGKLQEEIKPSQNVKVIGTKVISGATLIDQNRKNIKNANEKITTLQTQLIPIESSRSIHETEMLISKLKDDLADLRDKCEKNQKRLNENNKRCQSLRENRNTLFQQQLDLQKNMQGKPQMLERISEIENREKDLIAKIDELAELSVIQAVELDDAKSQMEILRRKNEEILEAARNNHHKHKTDFADVNKIFNSISHTNTEDLDKRFDTILNELTELKCKKEVLVTKKNQLTEKINLIKMEIASEETHFRNLRDNQDLRANAKRKVQLDSELEELNKKIGKQNYKTVLQEKNTLNTRKMKVVGEVQVKIGERTQMKKQVEEIKEDLAKPKNVNVYKDYRDMFIQTRVTEAAIKNMKLYAVSLENAICVYHRSRMAKINNHIRELWTNIYKGSDIDYIRIDTDVNFVSGRRSYKYQVMQKKNESLLEMRGRCSAGQKVLASLIIRMALAETFSTNCGILALDEPTTNLDSDNIASLSSALVNIINSHQGQKNFQLLIITHDETFLESLRGVNGMRNYYKVRRNKNNESVVTKEILL